MRCLRAAALGTMALAALAGCGAKTGLLLPDIAVRADAADVFEACVPGRFTLERRSADVLFVIDRSSSMALDLDGQPNHPDTSRWVVLRQVLAASLPSFEGSIDMGAAFFPREITSGAGFTELCMAGARIDVLPARNNSAAILNVLALTAPAGGTPTYEALRLGSSFLISRQARGRGRYMVLATDGGPNCNTALDPQTCVCTSLSATGVPNCSSLGADGRYNCLDDSRTLSAVAEAARQAIPTYVIGIDDANRPELADVLNRMAIAGGRPNTGAGQERYYSVRRREDLTSAFDTIQRTIARCAFVTPSRPDDPDGITVFAGGVPIARDATRNDGWDWTDRDFGELTLFGPTCQRLMDADSLTARVGCNDGG